MPGLERPGEYVRAQTRVIIDDTDPLQLPGPPHFLSTKLFTELLAIDTSQ